MCRGRDFVPTARLRFQHHSERLRRTGVMWFLLLGPTPAGGTGRRVRLGTRDGQQSRHCRGQRSRDDAIICHATRYRSGDCSAPPARIRCTCIASRRSGQFLTAAARGRPAHFFARLGRCLLCLPPRTRLRQSPLAAARHRQPRAALAPTSQRCRVGRVREALVCLIFESRLRPEPGFAVGRFRIQGTEESSLSCTRRDYCSHPMPQCAERISRISRFLITSSVGRAPEHSVLKPVQARLKICRHLVNTGADCHPFDPGTHSTAIRTRSAPSFFAFLDSRIATGPRSCPLAEPRPP